MSVTVTDRRRSVLMQAPDGPVRHAYCFANRVMNVKSLMLAVFCLFLTTACDESGPTGPTVPLYQQFTLAPGETASVAGTALWIQFLEVSGDSRCPADAFCIQGGDALVHIRVHSGKTVSEYELHTGDSSRAAVSYGRYRIELVQLQPYPFSSRTIERGEYRATLKVSR